MADDCVASVRVLGDVSSVKINSKAWLSASFQNITLYSQFFLDESQPNMQEMPAEMLERKVFVKSVNDGKNIAFLLRWKDESENIGSAENIEKIDGFLVEFASSIDKLPYVVFGSRGREVVVHYKKAVYEPLLKPQSTIVMEQQNSDTFFPAEKEQMQRKIDSSHRVIKSEGLEFFESTKELEESSFMEMKYAQGYWIGVLVRKIKSDHLQTDEISFPVAFGIWDKNEITDTYSRFLSRWFILKVNDKNEPKKTLPSPEKAIQGDAARGEKLVFEHCASCHRYKDISKAPMGAAPNLWALGLYANESYLQESLVNPSDIIVTQRDRNVSSAFAWSFSDEFAKIISAMPSFEWLDEKDRNDLVAFLLTLKPK
ncbi:MAG: c-type cytochrome [Sulfurospirillaceae bacterium]|nr:c-type cytochrome [Sulfurospirillaceae bacterium]